MLGFTIVQSNLRAIKVQKYTRQELMQVNLITTFLQSTKISKPVNVFGITERKVYGDINILGKLVQRGLT